MSDLDVYVSHSDVDSQWNDDDVTYGRNLRPRLTEWGETEEGLPRWRLRGNCVDSDIKHGIDMTESTSSAARKFCIGCPVKTECLEYGLSMSTANRPIKGTWAGLSGSQLQALARQRRHIQRVGQWTPRDEWEVA